MDGVSSEADVVAGAGVVWAAAMAGHSAATVTAPHIHRH
jgi:hypothetical protein